MANSSVIVSKIKQMFDDHLLSEKNFHILIGMYESYIPLVKDGQLTQSEVSKLMLEFLDLIEKQVGNPYKFNNIHKGQSEVIDYYQFGLNFISPFCDKQKSQTLGKDNICKIQEQLKNKENVILFANHQTEADPQIIDIITKDEFPNFAASMMFVAGDRVLSDPLAVPFSLGRNLICIYSKRHIDNPPELKAEKQQHNHKTIRALISLLSQGGVCIYVAPGGGRDRPNKDGVIEIAKFDSSSIALFNLVCLQSKIKHHFYPLALMTFDILPPPPQVEVELGELRQPRREAAKLYFGDELTLKTPDKKLGNESKKQLQEEQADYIRSQVVDMYNILKNL